MKKQLFKTIWKFAKSYLHLFIIAQICILVLYTVSVLLPLNLALLTDNVLYNRNAEMFNTVIIRYIILFIASTFFNLLYAYIWQTLNNKYVVDVKNAIFNHAIRLKAKFLSNMNTGDMMSRIDGDAEQFIHLIQRNIFHFVNSIIMCTGIVVIVSRINLIIAIILVIAAIIPIIITKSCGKLTEKTSRKIRDINGELSGRLFEVIKGHREIKLLNAKWWAFDTIVTKLKFLVKFGNKIRRIDFGVEKGIYLVNLLTSLVIYGFSAYLIYSGDLTIGFFLAILQYVALLHRKFNWMLRIYLDLRGRKVSVDRVSEILENEIESDDGMQFNEEIETIEFKNVTFGYDKNDILNDVSFRINKGENVALIGESGVGKTTILSLLLRLYELDSGEIQINGKNIKDINIYDLRCAIGVVGQDILLFDKSLRYNLCFDSDINDETLWDICGKVGLDEQIKRCPDGFDTILKRGTDMSGGQKQRIIIARILLRKPSMVVLDEATSALDLELEEQVINEFTKLNSTMLIISHRPHAIKGCDRVIRINDGIATPSTEMSDIEGVKL